MQFRHDLVTYPEEGEGKEREEELHVAVSEELSRMSLIVGRVSFYTVLINDL